MKPRKNPPFNPERFEDEVHAALLRSGNLVPTTVEGVRQAELEQRKSKITLPAALQNSPSVFERSKRMLRAVKQPSLAPSGSTEVEEGLARAAREGREITSDVEERMRRDREMAERAYEEHVERK
jgi:hypothetical protein